MTKLAPILLCNQPMGAEMSPGIEKLSGPMSSLSLVYPMSKEQGSCLPVTPV